MDSLATDNRWNLSEDAIRRFLLAQLDGEEQPSFEHMLMTDGQFAQRVRLGEILLTDDYAFHRLKRAEREQFQNYFVLSRERLNLVWTSTAVRKQFRATEDKHARAHPAILMLRHPAWRFAFASVLLVLILAAAWLVTKEPQLVRQLIPRTARPVITSTPTPEVAHHRADSGSASHQEQPSQSPGHEVGVQTVVLRQSDEPKDVAMAVGVNSIRLELIIENPKQATYRAEVMNDSGEVIYSVEQVPISSAPDRVGFEIPANKLKSGDFQAKLTETSDGALAGSYRFRIR